MPKPSVSEEELQLRKRARRRLVGAIVLVLLVIVVVPMFLDHGDRKPIQDIDVRIPPIPGQQAPPAPATPPPATVPPAQQQPAAQPSPAPPRQAQPLSPAETEVAISPPIVPAPKPEPAPASKAAAQEGFVIQLGAYGKPATAKQLLRRLKAQKFPAYTEPVKTPQGTRTRVRAGPYPTMEAAEKARERLSSLKLMPVSVSDAKVVPMGE